MGKKLAIKGHPTRGNEVIKLLKMMGGSNKWFYDGSDGFVYFIEKNDKYITFCGKECIKNTGEYIIYELEEFLEKYPFKVGDKVYIYIQNDDIDGRYDIEVAEITSMRWNPARCKIAYKMKDINREFYKEEIKCKVDDDSNKTIKDMGKKLAIKSHLTRGEEIIELLEMIGGKNCYNFSGFDGYAYYVIGEPHNVEIRAGEYIFGDEDMYLFTLEDFLAKYPFKVGDKVVYTKFGDNCDEYPVIIESMKWTGTTIEYTFNDCVTCLAKDLKMWTGNPDAVISGIYLNSCDYADEVELNLGDYEIEVRDGKTYAVLKKSKYPTTYAECCEVLVGRKPNPNEISFDKMELCLVDLDDTQSIDFQNPYLPQLNSLFRLRMCRDAYWKIAGEQMGLDKPWKPDWKNYNEYKYCLYITENNVNKGIFYNDNHILAFPSEEMRDVFCENFKKEIEQCKELL